IDLQAMGRSARAASRTLALRSTDQKNAALHALADELDTQADAILSQNALDVHEADVRGIDTALLDRLRLTPTRLASIADDTRRVADLPDPVGEILEDRVLPNGIRLLRRRVPLGVLGVIYEARPNVTIDIAALCLKTGNAAILRGGSETLRSNLALTEVIQHALRRTHLPPEAIQYIAQPNRSLVAELLRLDDYVDMIVPRGGGGLHRLCREQSTIPVITGGIGICHVFVDDSANLDRAVDIIENAKVQRPSVCNALDTLLVHRDVASSLLPAVARRLSEHHVALHADETAYQILQDKVETNQLHEAGPDDFDQEWLSLTLSIRIVDDLDEAIAHIQAHSTQHSDSILTTNQKHADRFVQEVDSAAVYVNASTRFTDGGEFGLGAEVAVSTQKLHARGPMGLDALTTYKWIGIGDGHIRE
ncbi:MAG TPA: glutamate-5-semialdehyde dehydrogenase, partial [Rhodothermales bacterium]|nr:glutamate-5-semialdehyde dehydrogenase [Rhodothermales bacterium]